MLKGVKSIIRQELVKLDTHLISSFQNLHDAFIANKDIGIVKEHLYNHEIKRTGMELLLGFYSEVDVSFDLYLQNEFFAHYEMKKGMFYPLAKENDKYSVLSLINMPYMKPTYIRNVTTEIYAPDKLFLIGAVLKHETFRKEIQSEPYFNQEILIL